MTDIPTDLAAADEDPDAAEYDDLFPGLGVPYDLALVDEDTPAPVVSISDWLAEYDAAHPADDPEA